MTINSHNSNNSNLFSILSYYIIIVRFAFVLNVPQLPSVERVTKKNKRLYHTGERSYPSVTAVLGGTADKSGIIRWKEKVGEPVADYIIRAAAKIGSDTHELVESYLSSKFVAKRYSLISVAHFKNLQNNYLDHISNIYGLETQMYSDSMGIGGTADCIAEFDGELSIIDFKTKRSPQRESYVHDYFLQCAAYGIMWKEHTGMNIQNGVILCSVENGEAQIFKCKLQDHEKELKERIERFKNEQ